ncbi:MAG: hypothetical protein ACOC0C_00695 [Bacteroidota bacterium]
MIEKLPLNVVIFHYHLNPGGVTRIIESQVKSLKAIQPSNRVTVAVGACANPEYYRRLGAEVIINPALNYMAPNNLQERDLEEEFRNIYRFFAESFPGEVIFHLHNLNLGKNPLVTLAGYSLAANGYRVVNHAHDFAEDRPENMEFLRQVIEETFQKSLQEVMYPSFNNYLFSTINLADLRRLDNFNINCHRKHLIPNPVDLLIENETTEEEAKKVVVEALDLDPGKKIMTYPVRVIKRKNIGEFILLSVLFHQQANWLVTLPPKNPVEIERYEQWKAFCYKHQIPVVFEAGLNLRFEDIIKASDFCVTTSIREGFGMVYLEPWLLDTPVAGRSIPYIIDDLKQSGMKFSSLYSELYVNFAAEIRDFRDFPINIQKQIIAEAKSSENFQKEIFALNTELLNLFEPVTRQLVEANKNVVIKTYSIGKFGERLYGVYKRFFE